MISKKELKEYIKIFEDSQLAVLELEDDTDRILMEKPQQADDTPQIITTVADPKPVAAESVAVQPAAAPVPVVDNSKTINSPMVGVFYSAPSPDSDPFVSVGKVVSKGQVVCIVEAMKIMNEITAEISGTVTEVLVNNGDVVEYGQPLFKVN